MKKGIWYFETWNLIFICNGFTIESRSYQDNGLYVQVTVAVNDITSFENFHYLGAL